MKLRKKRKRKSMTKRDHRKPGMNNEIEEPRGSGVGREGKERDSSEGKKERSRRKARKTKCRMKD